MARSLETLSYRSVVEKLGNKSEKRFSANSKFVKVQVESEGAVVDGIGLKLHGTVIAVWMPNGWVVINSGGYHTNTTKRYIDTCGISVFQKNYEWFVWQGKDENGKAISIPFVDNMMFNSAGDFVGQVQKIVEAY